MAEDRPQIAVDRTHYVYYAGTQSIPPHAAVNILNRSHKITAEVEIPEIGAEGVLISQGGNVGGYSFFIKDARLGYVYNYVGRNYYRVMSSDIVPKGRHQLRYEFTVTDKPDFLNGKGAPGQGKLYIDEKQVGQMDIPITTPFALGLTSGIEVGSGTGSPVAPDYKTPYLFTGKIFKIMIDVSGEVTPETDVKKEAEVRMAMARQ
jgi:arylsulfatase